MSLHMSFKVAVAATFTSLALAGSALAAGGDFTVTTESIGGEIKAGEPVHGMWLRITIDDHLLVHAAESWTEYSPFNI